jgi:hypothetical protein
MASIAILGGCASAAIQDSSAAWRPIDLALASPMDELRAEAELGQASAQYALSIVDRYGLRGAARDPKAADVWMSRAWAARRLAVEMPLTNDGGVSIGQSARAEPQVDLQFDLSPGQDALIRRCLDLLADPPPPARLKGALAAGGCGGQANYSRLEAAWAKAL